MRCDLQQTLYRQSGGCFHIVRASICTDPLLRDGLGRTSRSKGALPLSNGAAGAVECRLRSSSAHRLAPKAAYANPRSGWRRILRPCNRQFPPRSRQFPAAIGRRSVPYPREDAEKGDRLFTSGLASDCAFPRFVPRFAPRFAPQFVPREF